MKKLSLTIITLILLSSCISAPPEAGDDYNYFVARIFPTEGNKVSGVIIFEQMGERVEISGTITGLSPGMHGFHIHQFGDLSLENGKTAGGHYNPRGTEHGSMEGEIRHVGDLGNIEANAEGIANIFISDYRISLNGPESILGRSIIVHEKADDYGQPAGNAGSRIGYGVIGIGNRNY